MFGAREIAQSRSAPSTKARSDVATVVTIGLSGLAHILRNVDDDRFAFDHDLSTVLDA